MERRGERVMEEKGVKRALSLDDLVNHEDRDVKRVNDGSETDTDDETAGAIEFDAGMTFDYDKEGRDDKTKGRDDKTEAKDDRTETKDDRTEAKDDRTEAKDDKTEAKDDDIEVKDPQTKTVDTIFNEKTSNKSKRNKVKKDLKAINEIASQSKPNKYQNSPVWARKWTPTVKALQNINTKDFKLEQSILNFIPDDDMTKAVQDWIYATIFSIEPDYRQFIELEIKFGVLIEGKGPDRVDPSVSTQSIYSGMDATLKPDIDEFLFKDLIKYIQNISDLNENSGKFSVIESNTVDSMYRVGLATQRPRFLRMSTDVKTGRIGQFIEKRRIADLLIYSPRDNYDMKLTISLEIPVTENDPPEKYRNEKPMSERSKERISFIHNDSCTRFDLTKATKKESNSDDSKISHEVELEINTTALMNAFENIQTDSTQYASIVRTFLSNATIVRRKLTSLSTAIFEGKKKVL